MVQIFKFKLKDEYLPDFIENLTNEGKISQVSIVEGNRIYSIDNQYLRSLKIKSLGNDISIIDKDFLEMLLDDRLTVFITKEEYEMMLKVSTYTTTYPYVKNGGISYTTHNGYSYTTHGNDGWSVGVGNIINWP